jgi:hypothetical protein
MVISVKFGVKISISRFFCLYLPNYEEKSINNTKYGRRENYIFDGWSEQGAQQQ